MACSTIYKCTSNAYDIHRRSPFNDGYLPLPTGQLPLWGAFRSRYHFQQALASRTDTAGLGAATAEVTQQAPTDATSRPPAAQGTSRCDSDDTAQTADAPGTQEEVSVRSPQKPKRKVHPCPRAGCGKEYKQLSGLRYHLTHVRRLRNTPVFRMFCVLTDSCLRAQGHMDSTMPVQLDVVPPTLARMVAEKVLPRH